VGDEGKPVTLNEGTEGRDATGGILKRKPLPGVVWYAPAVVGKLDDPAAPATETLPLESRPMPP
jgi:hypothetical protein